MGTAATRHMAMLWHRACNRCSIAALMCVFLLAGRATAAREPAGRPWMNTALAPDIRAELLLHVCISG